MNGIPAGVYIPGNSIIHRLDAAVKIVSLFLLLAAVAATATVHGYVVILFVLAVIVYSSKLTPQIVLASIRKLWLFFIVIFLMNALLYSDVEPILSWGIANLTAQGSKQGARVVFNVIYIMILGNVLIGTTTPINMTAGFHNLMRPLKLLRIPVEDVAMIISIAIRFIPALYEEAYMIKMAQTARGAQFESKKLRERVSSFLPLLIPVFISAFRRADELSIAMEARGYRNARNRTKKAKELLKRHDFAALACCIFICLVQLYFK